MLIIGGTSLNVYPAAGSSIYRDTIWCSSTSPRWPGTCPRIW